MDTDTPRWYVTRTDVVGDNQDVPAATVNVDEYAAEAAPYRKLLVETRDLLPASGEAWKRVVGRFSREEIFTLTVSDRKYFPAFYLSDGINVGELKQVLAILRTLPGWSQWQFFTKEDIFLNDMTPLEALRAGEGERVRRAARAFVER
jgi:hypothetical protein